MEKIIGIDLGTTNSVVSLVQDGKAEILKQPDGTSLVPSVVGLAANGDLLVGIEALRQYAVSPESTVKSIKRHMGTEQKFPLKDRNLSAPEVSALILKKIKAIAENAAGEELSKAVITVPAYFSDVQRQATKQAGELAGLEVSRIINEPTAAALVYNLQSETPENVLVYDLGGGTFDVSIVEMDGDITEVRASHGNNMLGGDDFDLKLQNWLVQEFEKQHQMDLRSNPVAMARLNRAAENAKVQLSQVAFIDVTEEFLASKGEEPLHLSVRLSRDTFEEMIEPLLESTLSSIDQALKDASLEISDIGRVVLAGGSTRIPLVRQMLKAHLEQSTYDEINPDLCVAMGAAYQGAIISGQEIESILVDVTPYSLGVAAAIDTEEGHIPDYFSIIIPRNTVVPVSRSETYTNPVKNMDRVLVDVYQGEQPIVSQNISLGQIWIENLPPAEAFSLSIEVHFDFDVNGILTVTAHNEESGEKGELTVSSQNSQLSKTQMVKVQERLDDLWQSHELDMSADDIVDAIVEEADVASGAGLSDDQNALIKRAEVQLEKLADDGEKEDLEMLVFEIKNSVKQGDIEAMKQAEEELMDVLYYLEQ